MRRLFVVGFLALVACAGGGTTIENSAPNQPLPEATGKGQATWSGDVDERACGGDDQEVVLVRCSAHESSLAVCGDLAGDNTLTIDSGALTVMGKTHTAAPLRVGGDFTSYGGIEADNTEDIGGGLSTNSDWRVAAPVRVGADAFVGGTLTANNTVDVAGAIHATSVGGSAKISSSSIDTGAVAIAKPLDCPALTTARTNRDHDVLAPADGLAKIDVRTTVALGCARYRFSKVEADNELTLRVSGTTVIVVDGNVHIAAPMRIEVDPGAALDLVIGGDLQVDNTLTVIGDAWIGVERNVRVAAPIVMDGALACTK